MTFDLRVEILVCINLPGPRYANGLATSMIPSNQSLPNLCSLTSYWMVKTLFRPVDLPRRR